MKPIFFSCSSGFILIILFIDRPYINNDLYKKGKSVNIAYLKNIF